VDKPARGTQSAHRSSIRVTTRGNILTEADAHRRAGRLGAAEQCYRQALAADPASALAHNQLGIVLAQQRRTDEAIACFQQALAISPAATEALENLQTALADKSYWQGLALLGSGRYGEAAGCFRRTIEHRPDHAEAHNNLGVALQLTGRPDESEMWLQRAIQLKGDYADAYANLGGVLEMQGALSDDSVQRSLVSLRRAVELRPDCPKFHLNLGLALLRLGNFADGWPEYEWRLRREQHPTRPFSQPRWSGAPLDGRTILLYEDEGRGDTLQFARFFELVKQPGGRVVVECRGELAGLLASCPGVDEVIASGSTLGEFDVQLPIMSLPGVLRTTLDSLPAKVPYLFSEAARVENWKNQLGKAPGFKVGLAWQGNPDIPGDRVRSIPLANFAPLAEVDHLRLYSLQVGAGREQLSAAAPLSITDLAGRIADFHDTAAIMRNLDLVITCGSSPAHLAGALGVPVWTALAYVPDWRWMLARTDTPWYPTMCLYRQSRPGDWPEVFARISVDLAAICAEESRRVESC
jgi:Flp pilus assembly protein TadD